MIDAPAPPRARRPHLLPLLIVLGFVALVVGAIGVQTLMHRGADSPVSQLGRSDPAGAAACRNLRNWVNGDVKDPDTGKPASSVYVAMSLARQAGAAKTPAIRAAAGDDVMDTTEGTMLKQFGGPDSLQFANLPQLRDACVAAGEPMPTYTDPSPQ